MNHGVYVAEQATSASTPVAVETGVPFFIGAAPVQKADNPAAAGVPVLCTGWDEFVGQFGYDDDWGAYNLCEAAYSHFKLFGCQPVIFCNLLNPTTMQSAVAAADKAVIAKKVALTAKGIASTVVVKAQGGNGDPYVPGTDYDTYFDNGVLTVEVLPDGACYSASQLNIAYYEVTPASVNTTVVAAGMEKIELCMTQIGIIPDLICAPGYSDNSVVAAAMATKAAGINGMFRAKALVDISTDASTGADVYTDVLTVKNNNNLTDENEIVCWPLVKLGDKVFHLSTQLAGLIAKTDGEYSAPYVSPSNKGLQCDALVTAAGDEVLISLQQANIVNGYGVVTALNFMGGFKAWGNYTGCYPASTDVKDTFICVSRMFDWVANTLIKTFWSKVDLPMNRRLIDSILDTCNIWLNGLTGSGYILGGRCEMLDAENPLTNLMAGIIKLHIFITPPSPAQEIDFTLEYDASYVEEALS